MIGVRRRWGMLRTRKISSNHQRAPSVAQRTAGILQILRSISANIPELTDAELASARRIGRPRTGQAKQLIAFRIDPALLAKLKRLKARKKRPYQTLLHEILDSAIKKAA